MQSTTPSLRMLGSEAPSSGPTPNYSGAGGRGIPIPGATSSASLLGVKNARKRAEADVQLLANRLAHLKFEEERAQRKIEETEKKTAEMVKVRKKQMTAASERHIYKTKKPRNGASKSRVSSQRNESRRGCADSRKYVEEQRKAAADQQRQNKRALDEYKKQQRAAEDREKREKREKVRRAARALQEKRERERQEKEEKMRQQYARRIREENQRQRQAEKLIAQMEREEAQMLDRLQRTQDRQRSAYESLQRTIDVGVTADATVSYTVDPTHSFTVALDPSASGIGSVLDSPEHSQQRLQHSESNHIPLQPFPEEPCDLVLPGRR